MGIYTNQAKQLLRKLNGEVCIWIIVNNKKEVTIE